MYFYKNLYAGPSIRDPEEVKRKLMRGEGQFTIYVIALSPSRDVQRLWNLCRDLCRRHMTTQEAATSELTCSRME